MDVEVTTEGIALVITALGGAIAIVVNAFKTLKTVKETHASVQETHKLAVAIDNAVNTKDDGEQTIAEEVSDIHRDRLPR